MLALAVTHVFWVTSRAAGVAALLLASVSVSVGLTMGGRLLPRAQRELRPLHEALSLAALSALALHAVSLLFDAYLHPSVADVTVPFASSYREPWMGIGIVAAWATLLLGASYYARGRIGVGRWRRLHRFISLAWLLSIAHALGMGTEAGTTWFLLAVGIAVVPALTLLIVRLTEPAPEAAASASPIASSSPHAAAAAPELVETPSRPPASAAPGRLWSRA
jgi:sulfoxide reductase heme-binding subunit YedZ